MADSPIPGLPTWDEVRRDLGLGLPALRAWFSSRVTPPLTPMGVARLGRDVASFGLSPSLGFAPGAARHPQERAMVDPFGHDMTFSEAESATRDAMAWLVEQGIGPDSAVAVLGRNSAGFAIAIAAVARTTADLVYLNPGFRGSQIADLIRDRSVDLVLVDPDLADRCPQSVRRANLQRPEEWAGSGSAPRGRVGGGRHIILTSGTTGRPKGADRSRTPMEAAISLLDALPYRQRATHVMAAPMFHAWGWLNHRMSALLDTTEVMVPRPTAAHVLDAAERHAADVIVATPVVVARLAEAGPGDRDLSGLKSVLVSGAAIPVPVVERLHESFGPVLYNLYGATEVGFATCASPRDLQAAPDTAGRPLPGVDVRVLDRSGRPMPIGSQGEVWVGSSASFDGYIDGGDKARLAGLLSTGDLGHFDAAGRLFIRGRADDLIISGGENVHPSEVEAVLRGCPDVADVAAVGEPDPTFGQAVVAHVVPARDAERRGLVDRVAEYATEHLAAYQRPREVVLHNELPTNETGKVLRRQLRSHHD